MRHTRSQTTFVATRVEPSQRCSDPLGDHTSGFCSLRQYASVGNVGPGALGLCLGDRLTGYGMAASLNDPAVDRASSVGISTSKISAICCANPATYCAICDSIASNCGKSTAPTQLNRTPESAWR